MAHVGGSRASYPATNLFLASCEDPLGKVVTGNVSGDFYTRSNLFKIRSSSTNSERLKWEYLWDK